SYGTGAYYLACACDEILLMPTGSVRALGFSSTSLFLADGLARLGLGADFVQVSPYKSAADPLTKSSMSDELREQISWLLESQHEEVVTAIAESRLLDSAGAKELIDCSPYGDDVAVEKRAVDRVVGEEGLPAHLARGAGAPVSIGTWERASRKMRTPPPTLRLRKYVALMRIEGTIIDGRSGHLPIKPPFEVPLVGDDRAGDLSVVQVARQVAADKRAAAVVLYVNSRGGSSTASEAMRHELAPIAQGKVWSGRQALERKLVDELGGLDAGLAKARALAGLSDKVPMREVRRPRRVIPPLAEPAPAAGWFGYLLEGFSLLSAA